MDAYASCVEALHQISIALEESRTSEALTRARDALMIAQELAENFHIRLQDEYSRRQFLETVISSMADGVAVADAEQNITLVNDAARELFGQVADEQFQVGSIGIYYPDGTLTPIDEMPLSRGLRGERFVDYEIVLLRPDGSRRYLRTSGSPISDQSGKIIGAVVVMHDLTREHEIAQRVEEERQRLEQIVDRLPEGVLIVEGPTAILMIANRAARDILGDIPVGRSIWQPDIRKRILDSGGEMIPIEDSPFARTLKEGRHEKGRELLVVRQDQRKAHILLDTAPIFDQVGTVTGGMAVFRDVSSIREEHERLQASYEREHHIAEVLQRSLLPPETVWVEGYDIAAMYRPAMESERVGGDFFDTFMLPGGRVALSIGDVSGKGVEAAVFTSLARDCIRSCLLETPSPAKVLKRLNRTLYAYLPDDYFVTVFLAVLDPDSGQVMYASAGHDPPILYRRHGNTASEIRVSGRLAGIFPQLTYNQRSLSLHPGDGIFMYTDGLADARSEGEVFGVQGLAECLVRLMDGEPDEVIRDIYQSALDYAGGSLHDDAAAILLKAR